MERAHYTYVHDAQADLSAAFIEANVGGFEHAELIRRVREIVQKAYRSGVEYGLGVGSREADANAESAFARGFIEGEKHAVSVADAIERLSTAMLEGASPMARTVDTE